MHRTQFPSLLISMHFLWPGDPPSHTGGYQCLLGQTFQYHLSICPFFLFRQGVTQNVNSRQRDDHTYIPVIWMEQTVSWCMCCRDISPCGIMLTEAENTSFSLSGLVPRSSGSRTLWHLLFFVRIKGIEEEALLTMAGMISPPYTHDGSYVLPCPA